MSVNYAAGLSDYPNKGKCGQQEFTDSDEVFSNKLSQLVELFRKCKHCVVLTGAGISTSCGIPDFRGPKGVWTLEEKGITPDFATTFDKATFSTGHRALVALEEADIVKHLITQNVDGLHIRSGFPRDRLSILHGDMFTEECDKCRHQFIMGSSVNTMGLKYTGNSCPMKSKRQAPCRGKLRDTILDWEDSLPNDQLDTAIEQSRKADLFLVLGSSLQIQPAGRLHLYCKKNNGSFVTVNLQKTKYHKQTDLVLHRSIDDVMAAVCDKLGVIIPQYTAPRVKLYSSHTDIKSCQPLNLTVDDQLLTIPYKKDTDISGDAGKKDTDSSGDAGKIDATYDNASETIEVKQESKLISYESNYKEPKDCTVSFKRKAQQTADKNETKLVRNC